MSRLRRALSEATAAGEREYLDLEEQLAEAERSRAAAAARTAQLEAQLQQQGQGGDQPAEQQQQQQQEVQRLQEQVREQAAELEQLRQQQQQKQQQEVPDGDGLQTLQDRVQKVSALAHRSRALVLRQLCWYLLRTASWGGSHA